MRHLTFCSLLCLGLLASCSKTDSKKENAAPPAQKTSGTLQVSAVEGYVAKSAPLTERVTASGTLLPMEETELHPEASGRVVSLNLPEGRNVRKGELLVKIFDADLRAQLTKLETQLKQAEITESRLGELLKVKGVSQQEYDLAALQVQTLKSEMELVRINIGKTELRAPYDGVLGLRSISPGAYVTPATAVTTLRATGALKLDFSVPEKYSALIRPGQVVQFQVEGSEQGYSAKVLATDQSITADTRNLTARALVQGNHRALLPGAFAEVNLALGNKMSALMVPSQAIIPQARDKKLIVSRNGKAAFVVVKTGVRQSGMVEITEGIQAGDTVAVTGVLFLRPDAPLKFSSLQ
ncbi:MAG TPA: efflux RND transporter periplasmic adaptor subunit [Saprospiraceae bacterium]|nr:efflux RND transporter periplasmic adaptor subunit [Saprospiraceae bacterium]HND87984.1 efflux RND transporter periplasmic adaptor subunit [Saprospiraceae bacterium]HNG90539.1 efflux RND transporter periplasmic adaptor subunit [Saprospiraceae bacterium]